MNWIDIVWPMMGAASLTLALIHVMVWFKQKQQTAHLMFAVTAIGIASLAVVELLMMQAQSPVRYGVLLRWAHVPIALTVVGMVAFVRLRLRAGRLWLGMLAGAARVACLVPNFATGVNLNFREITALQPVTIWGDVAAAPVGVANPWMALSQLSNFLLVLFLLDAMVSVWRSRSVEERGRALVVCGSMIFFIVLSAGWTLGVVSGVLPAPITINPAFLAVLLAMSYELGGDILRAVQLSKSLTLAELKLHDSEQRMDLAVRASGIGLWDWDIVRGESWYSEPGMRMLGFASGEPFDQTKLLERVHPDDRENMRKALEQALSSDGQYRNEYRIATADGGIRWIAARGQIEFDAGQVPLRMHGTVADITQRGQAEESLRLVIEASPTALLMVDDGGSISLVNRQAEILFGYSRAELLNMNVDALMPIRRGAWHDGQRTAVAGQATARTLGAGRELSARRKDGGYVSVEIALSPIHSARGLFTLASVSDITERKQAAVQRDELAHLSRVVMLAELSGSLAHELNQPLTAILSNAQAALRFLGHSPPNVGEVRESLTNIVENDKRAGEVIRRLRTMLRKERAEYRHLDINDVVLEVLRIIRSDLLNRNVEIALELAPDLPAIEGDRVQLQQVLLNLMMNAADAMAAVAESPELVLRTQLSDAGGVQVSVKDVGRGIPADDLARIFMPFVTSKPSGMGLGLAVCESIIHAHRGTIWATNNARRGASFHFKLPALGDPSHPSIAGSEH